MSTRSLPFSADPVLSLGRAVSLLKVAGEPTRMRVLVLLAKGDLTVSDMTSVLGQSQPRISRHLRLLNEAGLIERYQEGSWAYFRLGGGEAGAALRSVLTRLDPADPDLSRDAERLEAVRAEHAALASDYFDANAADWDRIRALHAPDETVERAMLDMVGGDHVQSMLDLGTGTGRMLELFADRIAEGLGLDSSRQMLAIARAKLAGERFRHITVRRADILSSDAPRGRFDLVTMHQVLHFLDAPARAIDEAVRFLAPGGRLLIADFAPHDHEFLRDEQAHRRLGFEPEQVADWMGRAGLAVEEVCEVPANEAAANGASASGAGDGAQAGRAEPRDGLTVVLWMGRDPRRLMA